MLFKWAKSVVDNESFLRLPGWSKPPRVYVDAKILNVHDPSLPREAYVGYIVEGEGLRSAKRLEEDEIGMIGRLESDDAEILAILFAIDDLGGRFGRITVVCDHESVVSEANRNEVKNASRLMEELRSRIREKNPSVRLEVLKTNPAHGVVTEYVNGLKSATD